MKLIFLVQKQISEKCFQIFRCFVNTFLQVRIVCTNKCISEIPRIFRKNIINCGKSYSILHHLNRAYLLLEYGHLPSEGSVLRDCPPHVLLRSAYPRNQFPSSFSVAGSRQRLLFYQPVLPAHNSREYHLRSRDLCNTLGLHCRDCQNISLYIPTISHKYLFFCTFKICLSYANLHISMIFFMDWYKIGT